MTPLMRVLSRVISLLLLMGFTDSFRDGAQISPYVCVCTCVREHVWETSDLSLHLCWLSPRCVFTLLEGLRAVGMKHLPSNGGLTHSPASSPSAPPLR